MEEERRWEFPSFPGPSKGGNFLLPSFSSPSLSSRGGRIDRKEGEGNTEGREVRRRE
jgi:hypothetical protein